MDEKILEKKFSSLTNSQENIQSLSLWLLHHKKHYKQILDVWIRVLEKSHVSHRLSLFYLANDVVQNAKKKGVVNYVEGFKTVLVRAIQKLTDDKIRSSVNRTLNIWLERNVYKEPFISELKSYLPSVGTSSEPESKESKITNQIVAEFKLKHVMDSIERLKSIESDLRVKTESLNSRKINEMSLEINKHLKDKAVGDHLTKSYEEATTLLEDTIQTLEREMSQRKQVVDELTKCIIYYMVQKDEMEQEAKAYQKINENVTKIRQVLSSKPSSSSHHHHHSSSSRKKKSKKKHRSSKDSRDSKESPPDAPSPTNSDEGPFLPPHTTSTSPASMPSYNSSLDQRLSQIMQSVPGIMVQSISNTHPAPFSSQTPTFDTSIPSSSSNSSNNGMMHQDGYYGPVPPPSHPNTNSNSTYGSFDDSRGMVQSIQSVISSRPDEGSTMSHLGQLSSTSAYGQLSAAPFENFEPTDMDLSDDEMTDYPRVNSCNTLNNNNLKVIQPEVITPNDPQHNNHNNNFYNPQLMLKSAIVVQQNQPPAPPPFFRAKDEDYRWTDPGVQRDSSGRRMEPYDPMSHDSSRGYGSRPSSSSSTISHSRQQQTRGDTNDWRPPQRNSGGRRDSFRSHR